MSKRDNGQEVYAGCNAVFHFDPFNASEEEMMGVMRGKGRSRDEMLADAVSGMVDAGLSCEEVVARLSEVSSKEEIEKAYEAKMARARKE